MRKMKSGLEFLAPVTAMLVGLAIAATSYADDITWPDPTQGNPAVWVTCNWCQSQTTSCFTGSIYGCGNAGGSGVDPSWMDCGPGSHVGATFQQDGAQIPWPKCTFNATRTCKLYTKFYCAHYKVYDSVNCSGPALCSFWVTTNAACETQDVFNGDCS